MGEPRYMISDVSKMLDIPANVLRYYEYHLCLNIKRTEQGQRIYTQEDVDLLSSVKILKEKGFELKVIRAVLPYIDKVKDMDDNRFKDMKECIEIAQGLCGDQAKERLKAQYGKVIDINIPNANPSVKGRQETIKPVEKIVEQKSENRDKENIVQEITVPYEVNMAVTKELSNSIRKTHQNPLEFIQEQEPIRVVDAMNTDMLDKQSEDSQSNSVDIEPNRNYVNTKSKKAGKEVRLKAEREARLKAQKEARVKAQKEAKIKAEKEAQLKIEREIQLKAEQEAQLEAEREAQLEAEREAKLKAEQEAQLEAEREAKLKAEQEAQLEAEREAKLKAEKEAKLKVEKEAQLKAEKEARLKAEKEAQLEIDERTQIENEKEAQLKSEQVERSSEDSTKLSNVKSTETQVERSSEEKAKQFKELLCAIVTDAMEKNNRKLTRGINETVTKSVIHEMDYLLQLREAKAEERAEERFRQIDRVIRETQANRQQAAAAKESKRKKPSKFFRKNKVHI